MDLQNKILNKWKDLESSSKQPEEINKVNQIDYREFDALFQESNFLKIERIMEDFFSGSVFALKNSLAGFEFLSCIPGTIGGAIRMNSGCYEHDISKILLSVQAIDFNGKVRIITRPNIEFFYRGSNLEEDLIFISATFKGNKDSKINIKNKINSFVENKKVSQPSKIKTCGSTFKNPKNEKAWKLIKESGCAGMKIGDAQISDKHCNFFVNKGKTRAKDLENLIQKVKKIVFDKTGISLELELQIIGEE